MSAHTCILVQGAVFTRAGPCPLASLCPTLRPTVQCGCSSSSADHPSTPTPAAPGLGLWPTCCALHLSFDLLVIPGGFKAGDGWQPSLWNFFLGRPVSSAWSMGHHSGPWFPACSWHHCELFWVPPAGPLTQTSLKWPYLAQGPRAVCLRLAEPWWEGALGLTGGLSLCGGLHRASR